MNKDTLSNSLRTRSVLDLSVPNMGYRTQVFPWDGFPQYCIERNENGSKMEVHSLACKPGKSEL